MAAAPPLTITTVISDFLGSAPTVEEIVAFELPDELQQRALDLLARSRDHGLTAREQEEIEEFTRMGHFMNRVKLQAHLSSDT